MGWDSVVRRLNDVVGDGWNLRIVQASVQDAGVDQKGKTRWLAQVTVDLSISKYPDDMKDNEIGPPAFHSSRGGVGAAIMSDPDDAIKTAQAEALKKASNQFGMALELWTEEGREVVARGRAVEAGDIGALKRTVFEIGLARGAEATPESVAKTLGVSVEELQDANTLKQLITINEGL